MELIKCNSSAAKLDTGSTQFEFFAKYEKRSHLFNEAVKPENALYSV